MELYDKNQTLVPPGGYTVHDVKADGGYLRVEYHQLMAGGTRIVVVFLNDSGREVARSTTEQLDEQPFAQPVYSLPAVSVSRWRKIYNGFLLALLGIQEMFQ